MESQSRPALSAEVIADLRELLVEPGFWCRLPGPTAGMFAERRRLDFLQLIHIGGPLLLLMVVLVGFFGWSGFGDARVGDDLRLWWYGIGLEFLVIASAILAFRYPLLQKNYQPVLLVFGTITLALVLLGTIVLRHVPLAQAVSYVTMLIITIQVIALRLPLWVPAVMGHLAIASAVFWGWLVWGRLPDWQLLSWFCLGSLYVTLFVGAIQERQERISFLQGLLLEYESAERERLNEELERMAHQDALSGLANRRHFDRLLEQEWERLRRDGQTLALLYLDVDYFKAFNDNYGHGAGDYCLVSLAEVLAHSARRPGDVAARYGGEEFVVLLPGTDTAGAKEVADRILVDVDTLAIPHKASGVAKHVTVSIGVAAMQPRAGLTLMDLLQAADKALYAAKRDGRHRVSVFSD